MKSLELTFKSTDMRLKTLRLKYVNADLSAEDIHDLMTQMAAAKLFAKGEVELYRDPVGATLVETTKTPLVPAPTPAPVA